jgi:hypothetical protein
MNAAAKPIDSKVGIKPIAPVPPVRWFLGAFTDAIVHIDNGLAIYDEVRHAKQRFLYHAHDRHTALRLPAILRLCIAATISSSVRSGCRAISVNKNAACASSGEMLPPLGLGAMLPVACRRCIHLSRMISSTRAR